MKQSKYKIGDSVFFMKSNRVREETIKGVLLDKDPCDVSKMAREVFGDSDIDYSYTFSSLEGFRDWMSERYLYKTKKDLLNSL